MSGILPDIPPLVPPPGAEPPQPDALDQEDVQAHGLMALRGRWILAALNASLEQMQAEVMHHRLPVNVNGLDVKVQLCGAAAGAVTAAQLVATAQHNAAMRALQPIFDDIARRLNAIEAREKEVVELAQKMRRMLDAMGVPTGEEFARIMGEVPSEARRARATAPPDSPETVANLVAKTPKP